jgi:putative membrane-bound dehydrogenase-like protein
MAGKGLVALVVVIVATFAFTNAQQNQRSSKEQKPGPSTSAPRSHDDRLQVDLFAADPDIVHPIGVAFDSHGRLLVIESHTHFRPAGYKGPPHDRIRIVEDTRGTGKADRFTTFYEGTSATMGLAVHPGGAVYIATRNEILRLRDTKGDGKADLVKRIAFLDTRGKYPHNGLSGLAFDSRGNLYFGMGENEGADYKLVAADGTTLSGGGEGGNMFWCTADGRKLRRVATGFWNPFGICTDIFSRVFAVDNDPDAMPPCRLLHIVEGGDYGYQYRYGRSGRHPFQSWDGQIPGTLPMASGVGEAPCQVLSYESDGLPDEYRGRLLVASWADHRVECYDLKERGASVKAEPRPFVQGGNDFRPVGIAVAPDGSLFVSDWVKADYTLHGQGAIWHIRMKQPVKADRPKGWRARLFSDHWQLREAAARRLAAEGDRGFLRENLSDPDVRLRAACLTALINAKDRNLDLERFASMEPVTPLRALAVRALIERGKSAKRFVSVKEAPAVRMEAVRTLRSLNNNDTDILRLTIYATHPDPFLRHAAVQQLAHYPELLDFVQREYKLAQDEPSLRLGLLLSWRASGRPEGVKLAVSYMADPDEDVRFLAAKWIADQKLTDYRPRLVEALKERKLNVRLFFAYSAALARLDGKHANESEMADYFFDRLQDKSSPTAIRVLALQMIPPSYKKLAPDLLDTLVATGEPAIQLEAARALSESPSPKRIPLLLAMVRSEKLNDAVRAQAILGVADQTPKVQSELVGLAQGKSAVLRDEALRALTQVKLSQVQTAALEKLARDRQESATLVARVLGKSFTKGRPATTDLDAWDKRLEGPADDEAGRRVFFHPKLAGCYRCHKAQGRGQEVGPDLSTVGRNPRRHILESILQPSALVAPNYQTWQVETTDGKVRTGLLTRTYLDDYTYLDAKGDFFHVKTGDVVETRPVPQSIMPDGLVDLLTDQELRDLMAYLVSRR